MLEKFTSDGKAFKTVMTLLGKKTIDKGFLFGATL